MSVATKSRRVVVNVASNRMQADLRIRGGGSPITGDDVLRAMAEVGLPTPNDEQLSRILADAQKAGAASVVVARGALPVDDVPSQLSLADSFLASAESTHHRMPAIASQNQVVARVLARIPGTDGNDVYGKAIACAHPPDLPVKLGANVQAQPDGSIIATTAGCVRWEDGTFWIEPVLEIPGDVDVSLGPIDFAGDVLVRGNIADLSEVKSTGSIIVNGAVDSAHIQAGEDLTVQGGVVGKEKGHCVVARNLICRFASNAKIVVGGNLTAQTQISSSHVECAGLVDVAGAIIGGTTQARGGVRCAILGSPTGTSTLLEVGSDLVLRKNMISQMRELSDLQKKIASLREQTEPLLKNQQQLNAKQRELVTELLFEIDTAQGRAKEIVRDLRKAFEQSRALAKQQVEITRFLYAGVTIRFAEVQCTVDQALSGHLRLVPREMKHGLAVVALSDHGGFCMPLTSRPIRDELIHAAQRMLNVSSQSESHAA